MTLTVALLCAAALLALAAVAVAAGRSATATPIVYGASLAASLISLTAALMQLDSRASPARYFAVCGCAPPCAAALCRFAGRCRVAAGPDGALRASGSSTTKRQLPSAPRRTTSLA